mgnify:CR=1 FL=1
MPALRTIQARYTLFLVLFIVLMLVLTVVGISQMVAPKLRHTEEQVVLNRIAEVAQRIQGELNKVQAQQRSITQTVPLLDSDSIDKVLPGLVDQLTPQELFSRAWLDNYGSEVDEQTLKDFAELLQDVQLEGEQP